MIPVVAVWAQLRPPRHDPAQVRDLAHRVLARREFSTPAPSPLQRVRQWVLEQLGRLFGSLVTGDRASLVAWAVLAAGGALLVLLAVRFARGVTADAARSSASAAGTGRRRGADWRSEAAGHEEAGRWRLALRCRYRALVADLAERGLVEEIPGRTAGEYRVEVSRSVPAVAADFAGATELFEQAWYGVGTTGPAEAGRFGSLAERVLAGAGR